jgi:uncharacterized protein YdhG (YjbR/CyaY superfamily)
MALKNAIFKNLRNSIFIALIIKQIPQTAPKCFSGNFAVAEFFKKLLTCSLMDTNFKNIDEYIASFPPETSEILEKIRMTIKEAAPEAMEVISYQMPAYKLKGILVYFAAFKNHISFFPTASAVEVFKEELTEYKCSKGTIQFAKGQTIPYDLISKIVKFRVAENLQPSVQIL